MFSTTDVTFTVEYPVHIVIKTNTKKAKTKFIKGPAKEIAILLGSAT